MASEYHPLVVKQEVLNLVSQSKADGMGREILEVHSRLGSGVIEKNWNIAQERSSLVLIEKDWNIVQERLPLSGVHLLVSLKTIQKDDKLPIQDKMDKFLGEWDKLWKELRSMLVSDNQTELLKRELACLRGLADSLAKTEDKKFNNISQDLYVILLQKYEKFMKEDKLSAVRHNLATLFARNEKRGLALALWSDAYAVLQHDLDFRSAFSRFLHSMNRPELAEKILDAKEVVWEREESIRDALNQGHEELKGLKERAGTVEDILMRLQQEQEPANNQIGRQVQRAEMEHGSGFSRSSATVGEPSRANIPGQLSGKEMVLKLSHHHMMLEMGREHGEFGNPDNLLILINEFHKERDKYDDLLREKFSAIAGNCAVELEKREQFVQAEEIFEKALDIYNHILVHAQYADFLVDLGRFPDAHEQIVLIEKIDPTHPDLDRVKLKMMSFEAKWNGFNNLDPLLDLIMRISETREKYGDKRLELFAALIGNSAVSMENLGKFELAEEFYKRALDIYSHAGVHFQYADFLIDQKRFKEAKEYINQGKDIDPTDQRLARVEMKWRFKQGMDRESSLITGLPINGTEWLQNVGMWYSMVIRDIKNSNLSNQKKMARFWEEWGKWWKELSVGPMPKDIDQVELSQHRGTSLRTLADFLAVYKENNSIVVQSIEESAQELFVLLLQGYANSMDEYDLSAVKHNLAALFAKNEKEKLALALWTDVSSVLQLDEDFQLGFSKLFYSLNRPELAERVSNGEAVEWEKEESIKDQLKQGRKELKELMEQVSTVEEVLEKVRQKVERTKGKGSNKKAGDTGKGSIPATIPTAPEVAKKRRPRSTSKEQSKDTSPKETTPKKKRQETTPKTNDSGEGEK